MLGYKLDCHCHLDQYREPTRIADEAESRGLFIISMTNLPSHFQAGLPHVRSLLKVRLALGLHPLAVANHIKERDLFIKFLNSTSYIGEVGLDFSRGRDTKEVQLTSFKFVLSSITNHSKVVSLHSRGAEIAVLDTLSEFNFSPAIFHWYSGSLTVLDEIISKGHYFSINPSMVSSKKGQMIIERIPPERLLTETDGPYTKVGSLKVQPWDVNKVEDYIAKVWGNHADEVGERVWSNFQRLLIQAGLKSRS